MIPSSVETIDEFAFKDCQSLNSLEIPSSVTSITENAFEGSPSEALITKKLNNEFFF